VQLNLRAFKFALGVCWVSGTLMASCANADPEQIPCAVERVLDAKCRRCHGEPLQNGAPYQFMTLDQIHEVRGSKAIFERMVAAIETDFMPPVEAGFEPPVEPLSASERATLLDWVKAGALAGEACE
jgi:hypothetical protein